MNLWVNFGLKFTLFYMGKMAKISPKIDKIEIWPKSHPKVINSRNKSNRGHIWGKMGTFGKSARFRTTKNGTSSGQIKILRPLL